MLLPLEAQLVSTAPRLGRQRPLERRRRLGGRLLAPIVHRGPRLEDSEDFGACFIGSRRRDPGQLVCV